MTNSGINREKAWLHTISVANGFRYFPDRNVDDLAPLSHTRFSSIDNYKARAATIAGLLLVRRPSAIIWRVISIVVHTVKRVFGRRARPKVIIEINEAFAPASTHGNATATIPMIFFVAWIVTTAKHAHPRRVLYGVARAMLKTIFLHSHALRGTFSLQASATACSSNPQIGGCNDAFVAAGAPTLPKGIARPFFGRHASDDGQATVPLSAYDWRGHLFNLLDIIKIAPPVGAL